MFNINQMFTRKLLNFCLKAPNLFLHQNLFKFSSNSQKLTQLLKSISIQLEANKMSNLFDSGLVASQHIDSETGKVTIALNLSKDYRRVKSLLKEKLDSAGFNNSDIIMAPKQNVDKSLRKGNLNGIKSIIAVSSCKGGVGKSTVAINIAAKLQTMGHKVGIFDSDIYGPSLPTLINRQGVQLEACQDNPKQIMPIEYQGMNCMSFGFVQSKPAIMRGPMVSSVVSQLLHQTRWGQLDYLVVDMPPGTGDIQISLCQELKFDGAVIVTTPQRLAYMDVIKGIQMFQDLSVRILGVVQNMSYYQCSKCGTIDQVFGAGYTKTIQDQFGIQNTTRIPLMKDISKFSDNGAPVTLALPLQHSIVKIYHNICEQIFAQLKKPKSNPITYYNTNQRVIIIEHQTVKKRINPLMLRSLCKCAGCIDQLSGAKLIKKQELDPQVYPVKIQQKGNYAVAVVWSDGHRSSIYPYKRLLSDEIPTD